MGVRSEHEGQILRSGVRVGKSNGIELEDLFP
jgi:hypothetical protein